MSKWLASGFFLLVSVGVGSGHAWAAPVGPSKRQQLRAERNAMFYFSHLQPSPYTLRAGQLVYGSYIGVGITDFWDVGTDLIRNLYRVYNVDTKVTVFSDPVFSAALTLAGEYNDPDGTATEAIWSVRPGLVTALALHPRLAWLVGASYRLSRETVGPDAVRYSGFLRGTTVGSDLSWAYWVDDDRIKFALAVGATYDFSYQMYGVGLSHYFPGFKLGIHVYPQASRDKFFPIIVGGGSVQL